ncbi:hypothetical protein LSAT2_022494 [Lamellibrachia satsuma]|nr:hypothetical protein LSAT2_022494 [Lamellibrachia satsuma]
MAPVNVESPIEDCDYTATHAEAAVVAAMLSVHATVHVAVPRALGANTKMEKLKRLSVALAGTGEAWSYFITRWGEYKTGTKLGPDIVAQLLECCEEELRKDLTRTAGKSLMSSDEKDVLTAMKALAIRAENTMIARVALSNMRQGHEDPTRSFYARIKGQADTCKYEMRCTKTECEQVNNFIEEIIRNVIARGIADQEIQLDLLGEKNQDMPLKDMIEYIEAKESGKRSASRLLDPQSTDAISSSYRRGNSRTYATGEEPVRRNLKPNPKGWVCIYCGEVGHGKTPLWYTRRAECRAYGKKCQKCGRQNRLDKACLSGRPTKPPSECTVTMDSTGDGLRTLPLAHHLYDDMCDKWTKRASSPQPYINLTLTNEREDYKALAFDLLKRTRAVSLPVMADTGCQSCLIGIGVTQQMGLSTKDFIPERNIRVPKMSGQRCIVGGCGNRTSDETSLHRFPKKDKAPSLHLSWVRAVKNTRKDWAGPSPRSVICSAHFGAECFEEQATSRAAINLMAEHGISYRKRRSLKPNAIPTTFSVRRTPKKRQTTAITKSRTKGKGNIEQLMKVSAAKAPGSKKVLPTTASIAAPAQDTMQIDDNEGPQPPDDHADDITEQKVQLADNEVPSVVQEDTGHTSPTCGRPAVLPPAPSPSQAGKKVSCQSVTSAVESEEEQCICTGNQLQSLDTESEDTRYTPEDISQKRVSSNSPSPSRSPTCGRVVSVSLVKQSCDDYQVLQGLTNMKSEDHLAEMHLQEGFMPFDETCHQNGAEPTDYHDPLIQVKLEKVEPDDCKSNSGETRKWVVCGGGLLKEVFKVEHTDLSVEASQDSSENIEQTEL